MTKQSQNGFKALLNPVVQGVIFVVLVGGLVWIGSQVYHALVGF